MATRIEVGRLAFEAPDAVFLDTNFLLAARVASERYHKAAAVVLKQLVAAAQAGDISLVVSPPRVQ